MKAILTQLRQSINSVLQAYASILFSKHAGVGTIFLCASFWYPNAGMSGLIAALAGYMTARLLSFPNINTGLYIYNSLLVGLALGIVYQLDSYLLTLILLGSIFAVFLTAALVDVLWRLEHLPILSLPFVVVAFSCFFAAQAYGSLSAYLFPFVPQTPFIAPWIDDFFIAVGSSFFIPHPVAGLLFFIGLLWNSRYLALLGLLGYAVGNSMLYWLSGSVDPTLGQWSGFNYILTAMAIGGIYMVPGWHSFLLAMLAAALSSLLTMATQNILQVYGLPVLAIPFLFTTLTLLTAMRKRVATTAPYLLLESPALPEYSYERTRLAKARGAAAESIPLQAPFLGTWQTYQGFNGSHTHQAPWQHAVDFFITKHGRSFSNQGTTLRDFYCFGLPVLSPCHGLVVRCQDQLPDNQPGEVDNKNNWGNFLLIQLDNGLYVLLAHLSQYSIEVREGQRLEPGQPVARCGNTGRSPQPHLHLHVQTTAVLGSPTYPFHLSAVILQTALNKRLQYRLNCRPDTGQWVTALKIESQLKQALHLPVGLQLHYRYRQNQNEWLRQCFTVSMDLLGGFRLSSQSGVSVRFVEENGVLCFFERSSGKDILFDLWLLALGLTPLTDLEIEWRDDPSHRLLPVNGVWQCLRAISRPLGGGLKSHYQRHKKEGIWQQQGQHQLDFLFGIKQKATTRASIHPQNGCLALVLESAHCVLQAELEQISTVEDQGIPKMYHNLTVPLSGKERLGLVR